MNSRTGHTGGGAGATQGGVTLFELLVAMLLLGMVSTMIYSVLNVSIGFAGRGEKKIHQMARKQGLLALLHNQVNSAWYDDRRKKIRISADDHLLRIFTRQPLLSRQAGLVLALYRYNAREQTLYYAEKQDFYNIAYDDDYRPEYNTMTPLARLTEPLAWSYDADTLTLTVQYGGEHYEFTPQCREQTSGGAGLP